LVEVRYEIDIKGIWPWGGDPAYKWQLRRYIDGKSAILGDEHRSDTLEEAMSEATDNAHLWEERRRHEGFRQKITLLEIQDETADVPSAETLEAMLQEADQA
jgi:hypothetical protein